MANIAEILSSAPKLLVIFQGDVSREHERHIVEAMCHSSGQEKPAFRYHEETDRRPEERIYFFQQSPQAKYQAQFIGDLEAYHGLSTHFVERAGGIHVPPQGGPYLANEKLVIEAPRLPSHG